MESSKFVKGALILSLAGLISKVLSAGYRIPLQNFTGDIGFYIYQQVYPILGIALILSLYGFPTAVSKLIAEKERISIKYFILPVWFILFVISSFLSIILYTNAEELAMFIGDKGLISAYKIASLTFLLVPFTAVLRGVFQAKSEMRPFAYSQVGEQLVRVSIIIAISLGVALFGWNVYWVGKFAGIASIIGAVVAFLVLLIYFKKQKPLPTIKESINWLYYIRTIILYGLIASLSHLILLIIQFADSFTVVPGLLEYGLSNEEAMIQKGVFDRGQPLIQIGAVLGSSFGLAIIPTVAKGTVPKKKSILNTSVISSLKISFYLAWGACVGLIFLFPHINVLLYKDNQGNIALSILMLAVILSALAITSSSILQGSGYVKSTASYILIALALKWLLNLILVPQIGILGSSIGTVGSLLFLVAITLLRLKQSNQDRKILPINWKAFLTATCGMILFLMIVENFININSLSRGLLCMTVLLISTFGAIIYIYILIRLGAFTNKELTLIPFGLKLKGNK